MLGKLNNDEFAMGSSNETSAFGPVVSPWRRRVKDEIGVRAPELDVTNDEGTLHWKGRVFRRELEDARLVPGGSSGGSAAAVAAELCLGATGTDTGGSIRQPAAFTEIVGIKPTYGRCSRWGIVAFASSLDQAGPFARTVKDRAILLRSMAGHDPKDTTSVDLPVPDYEAAVGRSIKGMKIGIPKEYRVKGMLDEIEAFWRRGAEWLKAAGAEVVEVYWRTRNTRYPPTTSLRRRKLRPISPVMMACATGCVWPDATSPTCTRRRAPPGSAARCAGAS